MKPNQSSLPNKYRSLALSSSGTAAGFSTCSFAAKKTQSRCWPLVGLAALFIAGSVLAAGVLRGRGSFSGHATLTQAGGGVVDLKIRADGNVTHLGKSTVELHTVADFTGPLPTPIPPSTGVITAANGDTISFVVRWTLREVATGVFDTVGPFEINGGTGRFNGATGGGDYRGLVDTNTGEVSAEITGEVRL